MFVFIDIGVGCAIAGLLLAACRLKLRRIWGPLFISSIALTLLARYLDHTDLVIQILLGSMLLCLLVRVVWGRHDSPKLREVFGLLLIIVVLIEGLIGPTLRGAREIGRRQRQAEKQQR